MFRRHPGIAVECARRHNKGHAATLVFPILNVIVGRRLCQFGIRTSRVNPLVNGAATKEENAKNEHDQCPHPEPILHKIAHASHPPQSAIPYGNSQ